MAEEQPQIESEQPQKKKDPFDEILKWLPCCCCGCIGLLFVIVLAVGAGIATGLLNVNPFQPGGSGNGTLSENCEELKNIDADKIKAVNAAAAKYGIDAALIAATIQQESNWNPEAVSYAGARGMMQVMPDTWNGIDRDSNGDATDGDKNGTKEPFGVWDGIFAGTFYMKQLKGTFGDNLENRIAAYNAGPGNVQKYGGVPPFDETQNYVRNVMKYYEDFKKCMNYSNNSANNCLVYPVPAEKDNRVKASHPYAVDSGVDLYSYYGSEIVAAFSGTIEYSESGHTKWCSDSGEMIPGDTCNSILIKLDKPVEANGKTYYYTWYTHLSSLNQQVPSSNPGSVHVNAGDLLGKMGKGNSVTHLHFGLLTDRAQQDGQFMPPFELADYLINPNCEGGDGNKCWPLPEIDKNWVFSQISSDYGTNFGACRDNCSRYHLGNDMLLQGDGTAKVNAIQSGTVIDIYNFGPAGCNKDYILVQNDDGSFNGYGEVVDVKVKIGDKIQSCQNIASIRGPQGNCAMMHFERPRGANVARTIGNFEDPLPYLKTIP